MLFTWSILLSGADSRYFYPVIPAKAEIQKRALRPYFPTPDAAIF
jgi:hypothetical protein